MTIGPDLLATLLTKAVLTTVKDVLADPRAESDDFAKIMEGAFHLFLRGGESLQKELAETQPVQYLQCQTLCGAMVDELTAMMVSNPGVRQSLLDGMRIRVDKEVMELEGHLQGLEAELVEVPTTPPN